MFLKFSLVLLKTQNIPLDVAWKAPSIEDKYPDTKHVEEVSSRFE